jgi:hypothetical protein
MKVLFFIDKNKLKAIGGPVGYCYNIYKQALKVVKEV